MRDRPEIRVYLHRAQELHSGPLLDRLTHLYRMGIRYFELDLHRNSDKGFYLGHPDGSEHFEANSSDLRDLCSWLRLIKGSVVLDLKYPQDWHIYEVRALFSGLGGSQIELASYDALALQSISSILKLNYYVICNSYAGSVCAEMPCVVPVEFSREIVSDVTKANVILSGIDRSEQLWELVEDGYRNFMTDALEVAILGHTAS